MGTQDDGGPYGAAFDALNVFDLQVMWNAQPRPRSRSRAIAGGGIRLDLPMRPYRARLPAAAGDEEPARYLDILSYRQRPTWRLAYRNFGEYEALVTNQSVEARPEIAGVRWYEIRRVWRVCRPPAGHIRATGRRESLDGQRGAMDRNGNIALGYSVVNGGTSSRAFATRAG